ncbi:hypothetical protein COL5a_008222 [Colletotrichum fioriniae]|nr:uncharacterized protein COL516b_003794 [Colletotrichum fioriniae]KAJ0307824.1 hypothetical protein COL516b_003794 [Colletotrichum fioriniae]KAJ0323433.1 hypothetical protein COL5a_008222 [Colletotrichum fioriniae]
MAMEIVGAVVGVSGVMLSAVDVFKSLNTNIAVFKSYRDDFEKIDLEINRLEKQVSDLTSTLCSPKSEAIANLKKSTAALLAGMSILSGSATLDLFISEIGLCVGEHLWAKQDKQGQ